MTQIKIIFPVFGAIVSFLVYAFYSHFGDTYNYTPRSREGYSSVESWLLSNTQKQKINFENTKGRIYEGFSPAESSIFNITKPPKLRTDSINHLFNILGNDTTQFILADIAVEIPATEIRVEIEKVWDVLVAFENYGTWNPFHTKIDVVESEDGRVFLGLNINLGVIGSIVSYEEVYYVSTKDKLFMYGNALEVPSSLRVVWLDVHPENEKWTIMNSYDMIGGFSALFSRIYIENKVYEGFLSQHLALKKYLEDKYL
eukprot:snap_masked-scaffold_29-processed-gene-2.44-mRNA-1 protein AED:1.00 eAED:1.00 QI:0/-1/0/0/-1/1/1/0/256